MTSKNVPNGRFRWEFNYRTLRGDEGLSVRLLGPVGNESKELARFDCFRNSPHYHTAVYDHNTIRSIEDDDPVSWFLDCVKEGFEELISNSGGDAPTSEEVSQHAASIVSIESISKELVAEATEGST
ncbi:MAG: hypothetical protein F4X44_08530 [Gammaproteobacteria bacterium]|nr:hypothetical protein [Gammaproteobacteria bacterium]